VQELDGGRRRHSNLEYCSPVVDITSMYADETVHSRSNDVQ
jgi:hypothetical protein